jgi:hypothetical protein
MGDETEQMYGFGKFGRASSMPRQSRSPSRCRPSLRQRFPWKEHRRQA